MKLTKIINFFKHIYPKYSDAITSYRTCLKFEHVYFTSCLCMSSKLQILVICCILQWQIWVYTVCLGLSVQIIRVSTAAKLFLCMHRYLNFLMKLHTAKYNKVKLFSSNKVTSKYQQNPTECLRHYYLTLLLLDTTCPFLANSVNPDQLASANRSRSALFVIKYVNLYQQAG